MLDSLKERSYQLWSRRFDTAPLWQLAQGGIRIRLDAIRITK
jgi:hypothetical protein